MSDSPRPDSPPYGHEDTSLRAAGGVAGIERLVDDFYRLMDELPEAARIRRMHPRDPDVARDKLARFPCGWLAVAPSMSPSLFSTYIARSFSPRVSWFTFMRTGRLPLPQG